MKAIILVAGRGSRMKNLTDERPNCLVELRGKPLLDWQFCGRRESPTSPSSPAISESSWPSVDWWSSITLVGQKPIW